MPTGFPSIEAQGGPVDAKSCVEKGTGLAYGVAFGLAIFGALIAVVASYGVFLIVLLVGFAVRSYLSRKAMALIHGSGVKVGESQLPEIHAAVTAMSQRLGLKQPVEVYVVEQKVVNAWAVRYGKRNVILLTDEIIDGCLRTKPEALAYVLGHELGHIALNHTGIFRSWVSQHYKRLGRLDEYSADRVATRLAGNKITSFYGLLLLTVGHSMLPHVNPDELMKQVAEVQTDKYSKKAERQLTHPLLLNRIGRLFEPE